MLYPAFDPMIHVSCEIDEKNSYEFPPLEPISLNLQTTQTETIMEREIKVEDETMSTCRHHNVNTYFNLVTRHLTAGNVSTAIFGPLHGQIIRTSNHSHRKIAIHEMLHTPITQIFRALPPISDILIVHALVTACINNIQQPSTCTWLDLNLHR